jgi:hypothetical protein
VAISVFGIAPWSWVLLTNVVVRPAPFQRTTEAAMKCRAALKGPASYDKSKSFPNGRAREDHE